MSKDNCKVVIFRVNDEHYAADIMEVEKILGYEEPTKLPDSPKYIEGVINYAGNILPIMSLAKRFNIDESSLQDEAKIIVAKENDDKIGIIVDKVLAVCDVNGNEIEEAPEAVSGISKRYIKGLIKSDGKIIIFLNLTAILTPEEKELIKN